jgi:ketosteroid isomerase-like protein
MRKWTTVAALALALTMAACTKEEENPYATPESTVRTFAAAMKRGDFDGALDCYADAALTSKGVGVEGLSENEIRNLFLKSLEAAQEPYAKEDLTNLEGRLLTAEVTYELGGTKHTHTLVNQDGEWKIATDLTR